MEKKKNKTDGQEKEKSDPKVDYGEFQEFLERKKIENKILKEMIDRLQQSHKNLKTKD
jgi:predicted nuclease with TOPRIM domain